MDWRPFAFRLRLALTPYETREILFYKTDNGDVRVEILLYQENLWLTQAKMAELFEVQKAAIYNKGTVTAAIAKAFAESEFEKYRVLQDRTYTSDFDKLVAATESSGLGEN